MIYIQNGFKSLNGVFFRRLFHAVIGLTCLLYPFLPLSILIILMIILLIILKKISPGTLLYKIMCQNIDSEKYLKKALDKDLRSANNLLIAIIFLLIFNYAFSIEGVTFPLYVIAGAVAISTFATSASKYIEYLNEKQLQWLGKIEYPTKRYKREKRDVFYLSSTFLMLIVGIISSFIICMWIIYWDKISVTIDMAFFIAVIGSVTGALFKSIPSRADKNVSILFSSCMAMWLFASFGYTVPPIEMLLAFIFSLFLGFLAFKTRIADISALLSACLLGVLIIVFSEFVWFLILLTFFLLGGAFTKYKYAYKKSIGIAEAKGGVRSYENVFSNSMAALILAIAYGMHPQYSTIITYAYLGTVATATGDTLASEIGTTSKQQPIMITTLKPAKPGKDGAITLLGEFSAFLGSLIISILAIILGMAENIYLAITVTTLGGFIGTNIDSLLGATLQNRKIINNSEVNFIATFSGAVVSIIIYLMITTGFI